MAAPLHTPEPWSQPELAAAEWWRSGATPIPIAKAFRGRSGEMQYKHPAVKGFGAYWDERVPESVIGEWFGLRKFYHGIGVLMGGPRRLVLIEFEARVAEHLSSEAIDSALAAHGVADLWQRLLAGYFETSAKGGLHTLVSLADDGLPVPGPEQWAYVPNPETPSGFSVAIETKGRRGFAIVAPSTAEIVAGDQGYALHTGGLASIVTITRDEYTTLATAFRSLDMSGGAARRRLSAATVRTSDGKRIRIVNRHDHPAVFQAVDEDLITWDMIVDQQELSEVGERTSGDGRTWTDYVYPGASSSRSASIDYDNDQITIFSSNMGIGESLETYGLAEAWALSISAGIDDPAEIASAAVRAAVVLLENSGFEPAVIAELTTFRPQVDSPDLDAVIAELAPLSLDLRLVRLGELAASVVWGDEVTRQRWRRALAEANIVGLRDWDRLVRDAGSRVAPVAQKERDTAPGNPAEAYDWLKTSLGSGALDRVYNRGGTLVHTPLIGDEEHVEAEYDPEGNLVNVDLGEVQVKDATPGWLAAKVMEAHQVGDWKLNEKTGQQTFVKKLFPREVATLAIEAPEFLTHVRKVDRIVTTPVLRPDGTLLTSPGFDQATRSLYIPPRGLAVPEVPATPTPDDVARARGLLLAMIGQFPFEHADDRAACLGTIITPAIRLMVPNPYKGAIFDAPSPGSGKTLLATTPKIIWGGAMRTGLPTPDDELSKSLITMLLCSTGAVIIFDNVRGVIASPTLEGYLTDPTFTTRLLGGNTQATVLTDRQILITSNNATVEADGRRRFVWCRLDPRTERPDQRTGFAINPYQGWVRSNRGLLIGAVLTLARHWVCQGAPVAPTPGDNFARWTGAIRGILACAGIEGVFDGDAGRPQIETPGETELGSFLEAIERSPLGGQPWTARQLLSHVDTSRASGLSSFTLAQPAAGDPVKIPLEALPEVVANDVAAGRDAARKLGQWLGYRKGRWGRGMCLKFAGADSSAVSWWRVERSST